MKYLLVSLFFYGCLICVSFGQNRPVYRNLVLEGGGIRCIAYSGAPYAIQDFKSYMAALYNSTTETLNRNRLKPKDCKRTVRMYWLLVLKYNLYPEHKKID